MRPNWGRRPLTSATILATAVVTSGALLATAPAPGASATATPRPPLTRAAAHTAAGNTAANSRVLPPVIRAQGPHLYPEGVAWDPTRRAFLVGSARSATVSVVEPDGTTRPFITRPDLISTFGLTVDAARHRVLVTYGDIGVGESSSEATRFTRSGLLIADLRTGRTLRTVDLGPGAANDVTLAPDGTAWVTDTVGDAVVVVGPDGRVERRITDPRFVSDGFGVNGIAYRGHGSVIVGRYDTGQLFRVGRDGSVSEIALAQRLPGADGLALRPDGELLVSTNGIGGVGSDAVHHLRSADGWRTARETRARAWPDPAPTTLALTPAGAYALSGRIDLLNAGDTESTEFTLRRD